MLWSNWSSMKHPHTVASFCGIHAAERNIHKTMVLKTKLTEMLGVFVKFNDRA